MNFYNNDEDNILMSFDTIKQTKMTFKMKVNHRPKKKMKVNPKQCYSTPIVFKKVNPKQNSMRLYPSSIAS